MAARKFEDCAKEGAKARKRVKKKTLAEALADLVKRKGGEHGGGGGK